jgi:TPR repeat protein
MNGLGGRPDYRAAAYWFERAANKGNAAAQINLGVLYSNGWGVPRDPQRARALFVQASHSPDPRYARAARENLGQSSGGRGSADAGAVVGAALVGLVLLSVLGGGGGSSAGAGEGGGGSASMSGSGWPSGGGSSSLGSMQSPRPMASPMSGNTTQILHGAAALGGTVNRR